MQRQRDQRRISWLIDKIITLIFMVTVIYAIIQIGQTVAMIADVQAKLAPRGSSVTTHMFLPDDYSEDAYQAALQRYDIENGFILPAFKTEN